jgi:hypothetical protein
LFARNPDGSGRYAGRLLCRALCQGAALHYVNEKNGVKDFDIWSFESSRLQRHLPQSGLETMIADGFNVDPKAAFGLAVTMLTELASQVRVPLPPRPVPDNSVTFGTRFMLIAPHSPSVASHRSGNHLREPPCKLPQTPQGISRHGFHSSSA